MPRVLGPALRIKGTAVAAFPEVPWRPTRLANAACIWKAAGCTVSTYVVEVIPDPRGYRSSESPTLCVQSL